MKNRLLICALAMTALFRPLVYAQDQGVGDMMFTAGTVASIPNGASTQEWAWVQWMATDSELLQDRAMDVYLKEGDALSTNLFSLKGVVRQVTDPRSIALFLKRGEALGENLANLEMAIDSLYSGAEPAASLTLAEKLSAVISGSQDDPELYLNLVFVGRPHPAVAMSIGHSFSCKIPSIGYSTFEVRDHSTSEVIGRVTLEAGVPVVLPAPGPIVRVPEYSPMGNLNIRLRWEIPDDLKRLSLLQFGYNLYRMTESFGVSNGYNLTPPCADVMFGLVSNNTEVVKVNRMPILVDPASVTSNSWFAVDDNDGLSGGTPFVDGETYYYFVSALDLLSRDGDLSDGFMTFPCDRMAPSVPHGIRTRTIDDYVGGVHTQWVEVSWVHDINDTDAARYYVYRHTGMADMQRNATYSTNNRISGAIVPTGSESRLYYEDRSLDTNDWSIAYWYTVRAEDNGQCTNNISGNSAPAFGLRRDREGPPPATNIVVSIQVQELNCSFNALYGPTLEAPLNIELSCIRPNVDSPVKWAEFCWYAGDFRGVGSETNATHLGRFYFSENDLSLSEELFFHHEIDGSPITYFCRVGSDSGKVSPWVDKTSNTPETGETSIGMRFKGDVSYRTVSVEGGGPGEFPSGLTHHWGDGLIISNVLISVSPSEGAKTIRLYRRVDGARRTLIYQGAITNALGILYEDYTGGSVNGGRICYYYQLFDEHGNAGAMILICCIEVEPRVDLPIPLLAPIDSSGEVDNAPGAELNWFCATPGVERFEVALGVSDGDLPATIGPDSYELDGDRTNELDVVIAGVTNTLNFGFYRTGRVGVTFGTDGSPQFILESSIDINRDYAFMVHAIGPTGAEGEWSNVEPFNWNLAADDGPDVPWPARDMPTIQESAFSTNLQAYYLADASYEDLSGENKVAIKIGEIPSSISVETSAGQSIIDGVYAPMDFLYGNNQKSGQTVMPGVLYRYQMTNDLYYKVSGDVYQVSPMMEEIAYGTGAGVTTVYDPFICVTRPRGSLGSRGIYFIDTQPVVRGATYQYVFLLFDEATKEIDRVVPAGSVKIPLM